MCLMAILKPKNNYTAQLLGKMENSVPFQKKVYLSQFLYVLQMSSLCFSKHCKGVGYSLTV